MSFVQPPIPYVDLMSKRPAIDTEDGRFGPGVDHSAATGFKHQSFHSMTSSPVTCCNASLAESA